jgi:glucoamylase
MNTIETAGAPAPAADTSFAPGWPGIEARWTSSAKEGVGSVLLPNSRVWFTISHGILNEIYYPRVDMACTRDMGLIITDGKDRIWEEKRDLDHQIELMDRCVPAYQLTNTCPDGSFRIVKKIVTDPKRDVVLQRITFEDLKPEEGRQYRIFAVLAPHLVNRGANNTGWVGDFKGIPMLMATGGISALAFSPSVPWKKLSVGFVGMSDGFQDLLKHKQLTCTYDRAENGNIALTGEIDMDACGGEFTLAIGFGRLPEEAAHRTRASLHDGFYMAFDTYAESWREWHDTLEELDRTDNDKLLDLYRVSASVIRAHEATSFTGGYIASLSIPWGFSKGDDDLGGYHLVWPRDLCETAGSLLAIGALDEARNVLLYLQTVQEEDGHWPQNMWLDGSPYWTGLQMDECAFPLLTVEMAHRAGALKPGDLEDFMPMVLKAAGFVAKFGPVTGQDRWEEDAGYSPFTLAVEIAGLIAAAALCDITGYEREAQYLREVADTWNDQIERWTYASNTELAKSLGIEGYYVRISPLETSDAASPLDGFVAIKNRPMEDYNQKASMIISPDALALVRFGLRDANDPRMLNTVKAVDHLLKIELPQGSCWRRYNFDGYGEKADGSPFDGTGIGRAWPLLSGERAHYELQAGNVKRAEELRDMIEASANAGALLPEQLWDAEDIPDKGLEFGKPAGSAMPLVWAHGEYVKLLRSLRDGKVFDVPPQTYQRYVVEKQVGEYFSWRFNNKPTMLPKGKKLRVEALAPVTVHWTTDNWLSSKPDADSMDTGLGVYTADLDTTGLPSGALITLTFYWVESDKWEGTDFEIRVV